MRSPGFRPFVKRHQHILYVLAFLAPIIFLISPFFPHGIIKTFDGPEHLFRIAAIHQSLIDGDFPASWASHLAYGFGTPVFLFNWTLPYYLAQPFLVHFSVIDSLKIVEASAVVASFFTMLLLLRKWFSLVPALMGAFFYCFIPHRIYLLYTSGSLGENVSFILWPLVILSVVLLSEKKYRFGFMLGSVSFALLMLTHQVMFLLVTPFWFCLMLAYAIALKNRKIFAYGLGSWIAGLLLTAFFWVPAILEKGYIHIDENTGWVYVGDLLPFRILLLEPGYYQLTGDQWFMHIYGFGWIALATPILWIFAYAKLLLHWDSKHRTALLTGLISIGFMALSLFLVTKPSLFLWRIIPLLPSIIYPYRFEALALFTASILFAGFIAKIKPPWFLTALILVAIVILTYPAIPFTNPRIDWPDVHFYYGDSTSDMSGEFLPKWSDAEHFFGDNRWQRYALGRITRGNGTVSSMVKRSSWVSFSVHAITPVTVTINQLYFPGWQVTANGKVLPIGKNSQGEMTILLSPGMHEVRATYVGTGLAHVTQLLSLVALCVFAAIACIPHCRARRHHAG